MRRIAALCLLVFVAVVSTARAEEVIVGLSQNRVAITANFDGSEIIIYGAIARSAPAPERPLDVIVTIEGPSGPVTVRRKSRLAVIWLNTDAVVVTQAPAFYAIATTGPLPSILSETDDLRHRISIQRAIRTVGAAEQAADSPAFLDALIRLQRASGAYTVQENTVLMERDTLFRADVRLPANLTEGVFRARVFVLRDGLVIDHYETEIDVHKDGIERALHRLAYDQPLIYGILALVIAGLAGWAASAGFALWRR